MRTLTYQKQKQKTIDLCEQAIAIAHSLEKEEIAREIHKTASHLAEGKLLVVVCGEFKQGKSQLINAMLNEPSLFPVDVDITTNLVTTMTYSTEEKITVLLGEQPQQQKKQIERSEIPDYVTEQRNKRNVQQAQRLMIESPNEFLQEGMTLVDTPGVGGLYEQHTAIAHKYILNADAILFVSDALEPLTQVELDFLQQRVLPTCQNILFVVTKIDATRDYQTIVESNHAKLAELTQWESNEPVIIPVSNKSKLAYLQSQDEEDLEDSHFVEMEQAVWKMLNEQRGHILLMRALRELEQATSNLYAPIQAEWEVYQQQNQQRTREMEKQAKQTQERLQHLLSSNAEWQNKLRQGLQDIRSHILADFQNGFRKIYRTVENDYLEDTQNLEELDKLRSQIEADIDALVTRTWNNLVEQMATLYAEIERLTHLQLSSGEQELPYAQTNEFSLEEINVKRKTGFMEQWYAGMSKGFLFGSVGVATGKIIGSAIGSLVGGIPGAALGASLLGGTGFLVGKKQSLKQSREKDKHAVWKAIRPSIEDRQHEYSHALQEELTRLERSMQSEFTEQLKREKHRFEETLQSLNNARKLNQEQAKQRSAELQHPLQQLEHIQRSIDELVDGIEWQQRATGRISDASSDAASKADKGDLGNWANAASDAASNADNEDSGSWADE
jgi:predicted GTPase